MSKETYFSVDIETDGPTPGTNSLLSIGAVALQNSSPGELEMRSYFSVNVKPGPGLVADPETKKFWDDNPAAYKELTKDRVSPAQACKKFVDWVLKVSGESSPVFVAYPAGFDFSWIYYYLQTYCDKNPFKYECLDMKSFGMALNSKNTALFQNSRKSKWPTEWSAGVVNSLPHVALNDAIEQAVIFQNMYRQFSEK